MSKIILKPDFPKMPSGIDSADVKENIDNWLDRGLTQRIETYLVVDPNGHRGYRFLSHSDFEKITDTTEIELKGVKLQIKYHRLLKRDNFCPLWFSERGWGFFLYYGENQIHYKSDAQLTRVLWGLKNRPYTGKPSLIVDYIKSGEGSWHLTRTEKSDSFYSGYFGR